MPEYRSDLHRLNTEAQAITQAQRRQMVEDARCAFGEAAAQALAARFRIPAANAPTVGRLRPDPLFRSRR